VVLLTSEKWLQSCSYCWLLRCCWIVFTFLNSFRVKARRVANNSCGLSGQSLVFGMDPTIDLFEGRIGVTPPLDLRPDVGSVEPPSEEVSLPTSVEPTSEVFLPMSELFLPTSEVFLPTSEVFLPMSEVSLPATVEGEMQNHASD